MKIIKNRTKLKKVVDSVDLTQKETDHITHVLTTELSIHGGIGLSINQIDLGTPTAYKGRACIINVIEPLVLINPKIIKRSTENVAYAEQCLSDVKSLKKPVKTVRSKSVTIECDNLGIIEFGPTANALNPWKSSKDFFSDQGMLECVCVQHEIDHLDGILMTDTGRRYTTTVTAPHKYGRNERVMVKLPNGETEFMKYKKAVPMLALGCEIL